MEGGGRREAGLEAQVLSCRRMRRPSLSEQRRRCGPRRARCRGAQRPVHSWPPLAMSRWWKSRCWIARPRERRGPGWRRFTMSARSWSRPARSVDRPGQLHKICVREQWGCLHSGHTPRTSVMAGLATARLDPCPQRSRTLLPRLAMQRCESCYAFAPSRTVVHGTFRGGL